MYSRKYENFDDAYNNCCGPAVYIDFSPVNCKPPSYRGWCNKNDKSQYYKIDDQSQHYKIDNKPHYYNNAKKRHIYTHKDESKKVHSNKHCHLDMMKVKDNCSCPYDNCMNNYQQACRAKCKGCTNIHSVNKLCGWY